MKDCAKKITSFQTGLCIGISCLVLFATSPCCAWESILNHKKAERSDEIASFAIVSKSAKQQSSSDSPYMNTAAMQPDSASSGNMDYGKEEKNGHLIRDISVFLIVSAFVGYFLIKVFIEGETTEPSSNNNGKVIPGG